MGEVPAPRSAASRLAAEDVLPLDADWLHLTGITMGLSPDAAKAVTLAAKEIGESGGRISFDVNHRPGQWPGARAASGAYREVLPCADWVFCGIDEGREVFGASDAEDLVRRLRDAGAADVLVRVGTDGAYVTDGGALHHVPIPDLVTSVADEIGAGDAFGVGFVYGRLTDKSPVESALLGHRPAARAIAGTGDWETLPRLSEL